MIINTIFNVMDSQIDPATDFDQYFFPVNLNLKSSDLMFLENRSPYFVIRSSDDQGGESIPLLSSSLFAKLYSRIYWDFWKLLMFLSF